MKFHGEMESMREMIRVGVFCGRGSLPVSAARGYYSLLLLYSSAEELLQMTCLVLKGHNSINIICTGYSTRTVLEWTIPLLYFTSEVLSSHS